MRWTGRPEVLVVTMALGLRNWATRERSLRLISRFSATTSMIQSASATRARSSSKLPMEIFTARAGVKNAAGRDCLAASRPARTILLWSAPGASGLRSGGTMSRRMHGRPALAKWAAMRAPIVPAPRTAAFWIERVMRDLFEASMRRDRLQNQYGGVKRGKTPIGRLAFAGLSRFRKFKMKQYRGSKGRFRMVLRCQ